MNDGGGKALMAFARLDQTAGGAPGTDARKKNALTRLDRYIFRQILAAFGLFVLVFTGVVWLTQAVRLIDTVVASGQGAGVFLQFSALVLPQVFVIVLPLSAIGAALYGLNKLYTDSELVVMMAAGMSPAALLRPVGGFGAVIALVMGVVLLVLVPRGGAVLADRTQAISADVASAFIVERQFIHPAPGLTLFINDTSRAGEMSGIFLNDARNPQQTITYSADAAQLLRDDTEARLVMLDGLAISDSGGDQLNSVTFDQLVFDLSEMLQSQSNRTPRPSEYGLLELLSPSAEMLATDRYGLGHYIAEAHYKVSLPLLTLLYPMIALVTMLAGGYRRSGFGRRVFVAVGVAAVLQIFILLIRARVQDDAALWPFMYAPIIVGAGYIALLLVQLGRSSRPIGARA